MPNNYAGGDGRDALFVSGKTTTPSNERKLNECFLFSPSFYSTLLSYGRNLTSVRAGTEYIQVMEAAQASTGLAGGIHGGSALQNVNHIAHLSGALIGVALIWMLSGISSEPDAQNNKK